MNLGKHKERLQSFCGMKKKNKTKNSCIIHCYYYFFVFGMCTLVREGRGNRIKQLLTSTSNFMLITPSLAKLSSSGEIDLGYVGVPRSLHQSPGIHLIEF